MSRQVMLTVGDFYHQPDKADGYREDYGLTPWNTMSLDSGGFQFLMGKFKGTEMETLPCGIEVPINAQKTIELYKRTGLEAQDLPIQLDLPPRYDLPPDHRRQLIERSAFYYYEMAPDIKGLVPVIHGWTKEELEHSLRLVEDPDYLASGTNLGSSFNWTMGNMNPHKHVGIGSNSGPSYSGKEEMAAGVFNHPEKSAIDFVNSKKIAVGTNKGLTTVDYSDYAVSRGLPKVRATPVPGAIDLGIDTPFIDKVVSTPVPTKVELGISSADNRPAKRRKMVSAGTFVAASTGPVGEIIAKEQEKEKNKRVPADIIIDRIVMVANMLCEDYEVFWLGGASPHMTHQLFMLGGKWTDTSAWRIKGVLGEIYLPERTERGIGYGGKTRRMDDEDHKVLKECLRETTHPVCGMNVDRFLEIGRMLMPEWYETWPKNRWEIKPFKLRCLHNAWVLKCVEEPIANDLSQDPEKYYQYLRKRLASDYNGHPKLVKRLDRLAKLSGLKRSGQTDLSLFLKDQK